MGLGEGTSALPLPEEAGTGVDVTGTNAQRRGHVHVFPLRSFICIQSSVITVHLLCDRGRERRGH